MGRSRLNRKRATIAGAAVIMLGAAWWLFGFEVHRLGGRTLVFRRVFGRVTTVHRLIGLSERERYVFPWSEPYRHGHASPLIGCAAIFPMVLRDDNSDGQWDIWLYRTGPDAAGECRQEYRVDTDLDGQPDWTFAKDFNDYKEAAEMVKARRGF